jgi:hypothetical protein
MLSNFALLRHTAPPIDFFFGQAVNNNVKTNFLERSALQAPD